MKTLSAKSVTKSDNHKTDNQYKSDNQYYIDACDKTAAKLAKEMSAICKRAGLYDKDGYFKKDKNPNAAKQYRALAALRGDISDMAYKVWTEENKLKPLSV